ncbi:VOC family protein [Nonomuraea soli]|uniref:Glyoxalase-like domain-containing protein n=1 Tax=Nonomuraea soli TaxID=1032476 RepID=A0A7W0HUT0_9ACTN|nr:VOC family protein [Nonomuraea soli]MBA2896272.1 hypothetical protein [Nonomuraea soli]
MATRFQITVDCADPDRLAHFWAAALHYELQEPPDGFDTWADYWRSRGLPEEEVGDGLGYDSIVDPSGAGPRLWFQQVPEKKEVKNRLHLDLDVTNRRSGTLEARRELIDAEAARLIALGATISRVAGPEIGITDYYAITLLDPEGNEFCIS